MRCLPHLSVTLAVMEAGLLPLPSTPAIKTRPFWGSLGFRLPSASLPEAALPPAALGRQPCSPALSLAHYLLRPQDSRALVIFL